MVAYVSVRFLNVCHLAELSKNADIEVYFVLEAEQTSKHHLHILSGLVRSTKAQSRLRISYITLFTWHIHYGFREEEAFLTGFFCATKSIIFMNNK